MSKNHETIDREGMAVLAVKQMNKRFDPKTGVELPVRQMGGVEIVHASEVARYYGLDIQDVGFGDNRVLGVWSLVHANLIGQRVPYNSEETRPSDRIIRDWKVIKNERGLPVDTEEVLKEEALTAETDDGMYVRLADVLRYAKADGWTKGGGWPEKGAKQQSVDISAIVAAVLAALGHGEPARKAK